VQKASGLTSFLATSSCAVEEHGADLAAAVSYVIIAKHKLLALSNEVQLLSCCTLAAAVRKGGSLLLSSAV
jgi:hypothetical protein